MAATETVYLRLDPGLKDRLLRAARKEKRSLNAELILRLERSLATGAGGLVSAGLAGSSALVASDGALAETGTVEVKQVRSAAMDAPSPVSPPVSASAFVPDALKPPGETAAELAASVPGVAFAHSLAGPAKPLSKQEQAGRKK